MYIHSSRTFRTFFQNLENFRPEYSGFHSSPYFFSLRHRVERLIPSFSAIS